MDRLFLLLKVMAHPSSLAEQSECQFRKWKTPKGKGSNSFTMGHGAEKDNLPSKIFVSSIIMFNK